MPTDGTNVQDDTVESRVSVTIIEPPIAEVTPEKPKEFRAKHSQFRDWLKNVLDYPDTSILAKVYFVVMMCFVIASVVISILDSFPSIDKSVAFITIDCIIAAFFTIEFILRVYAKIRDWKTCVRFFKDLLNIFDILALISQFLVILLLYILHLDNTVPNLNAIRILRLFRIMKIARYSSAFQALFLAIKASATSLIAVALLFFMFSLIAASAAFYAERGTLDTNNNYVRPDGSLSPFGNIIQSLWWAVVTLATLGYGDVYPITIAGKIIGTFTVLVGLLIIALPSTIIGKHFNQIKEEHEAKQSLVKKSKSMSKQASEPKTLRRDEIDKMVKRQDEMMDQLRLMTMEITSLMGEMAEKRKILSEYLEVEKQKDSESLGKPGSSSILVTSTQPVNQVRVVSPHEFIPPVTHTVLPTVSDTVETHSDTVESDTPPSVEKPILTEAPVDVELQETIEQKQTIVQNDSNDTELPHEPQ